jgi:bifunctional ADP-heptose synthase (sugar kinase/adenylyltransferase)
VLANVAASVVVGEVGTAPITAEKLLRAAEMHNLAK